MTASITEDKIDRIIGKVCEILLNVTPEDVTILSHPDHDGLTATVLFNTYFIKHYGTECKKVLRPTKEMPYYVIFHKLLREKPKILLILDALVGKHKDSIRKLVEEGTVVINMDHHDIVNIEHSNYINVNPHVWGIEYLNTSSLAWQVLRKIDEDYFDERSWLAGIGSVQDYCYRDNTSLFKTMYELGLSNISSYEDIFDSELMKCAKMINAACRDVGYEYVYSKTLNASISDSFKTLLKDDKMLNSYSRYMKELTTIYDRFRKTSHEYSEMNLIAYRHNERARTSLIAEICEMDRRPLIYFGYYEGMLGFSSLFLDYDVRKLARLFNGGGPHPKIAGGKTKKSFNEIIDSISEYLHPKQRLLRDFY